MNATKRRERIRKWLEGDECIYAPNVYDPISALVAQDVGFELGILTAHGAEWMINGGNELCRVTITELAEQARRIYRATDLSVMVTGPFGFGNALNEMRYVEDLESAGASMLCIGDLVLPFSFGSTTGVRPLDLNDVERRRQPLNEGVDERARDHDIDLQPHVSVEEYAGKIKAALAARQDPSLVIAARTNALMVGDIPEAVRRIKAYEAAGAETVWFSSPTIEGIEAIHAATDMPLMVGGSVFKEWRGRPDSEIRSFLKAHGVRIASVGAANMRAVVRTYYDTYTSMREGRPYELPNAGMDKEEFDRLTGLERDNERIRQYLN